ncbi:DoxX family protein [Staphylococcus schleiferi]|uniref:TQO small subunit DoxD n=1 Tax=Staphylococcus coagulans TaxID=74706 RepID=UPI00067A196F|nr:TQO small subunit DoxD [Staphylococcus coagulans]AKS68220.1 DoxX family protein [Staphylococcus schleiferi]AKS70449.1 DoxX family protein [Staphylococcus schleiferi]AKS72597.1 DoxX family protein [Staphylococcus schleiferi]MBT2833342.1 DoxX family membrane protein [Staphylococcus coagulans]
MIKWLQESKIASVILLLLRLYLGISWFKAGIGKLLGGGFNAGGFLQNAVQHPVMSEAGVQYPIYTWFLKTIVLPMTPLVNVLIPLLEVIVGLLLILGLFTSVGVFVGLILNFMFLFAGTVSVNPLYILISVFIFMGGYNSGKIGLDYFIKSILSTKFFRFFNYYPESHQNHTKSLQ